MNITVSKYGRSEQSFPSRLFSPRLLALLLLLVSFVPTRSSRAEQGFVATDLPEAPSVAELAAWRSPFSTHRRQQFHGLFARPDCQCSICAPDQPTVVIPDQHPEQQPRQSEKSDDADGEGGELFAPPQDLSAADDSTADDLLDTPIDSNLLAGTFGAPRGPASAAPNMIGDFFGGTSSSQLRIPMLGVGGASTIVTLQFAPSGGTFGDSTPTLAVNGAPVQFSIGSDLISGVSVPATVFASLINREAIGGMAPGETFALTSGSVEYQQARINALIASLGAGQAQFLGGEAELRVGDSFPGPSADDMFFVRQFVEYVPFNTVIGPVLLNVPSPSSGGGVVGRMKIAENSSPIPRDRVFVNYSMFDNVPLSANGVTVNRFSPGFEKTFYGGMSSFELRVPMASTLSSDILAEGATNTGRTELGNLMFAVKTLLHQSQTISLASGLAITVPTADDLRVSLSDGTTLVRISNQSTHLLPFIGALYTPNERFFAQGFLQVDFGTTSNQVQTNWALTQLRDAGRINDATFLYADLGMGYWLFRDNTTNSGLTGIAPTMELHYNRSLQDTDVVNSAGFQIGSYAENIEVLNLVLGVNFQWNNRSTLTLGYTTPLAGGIDKEFDGELRAIFNHSFGPGSRATRSFF